MRPGLREGDIALGEGFNPPGGWLCYATPDPFLETLVRLIVSIRQADGFAMRPP